ncbi:MAG: CRTAC1 family protein [Bryobacteraceae bacterium]
MLDNNATPEKRYIETMAGGVATFDYNGDGRTDIFFTNGAETASLRKESGRHDNRLFRNDGGMRFSDVTAQAGVAGEGYSIGAAAGDYDNDGYVDLFVSGVNRNILYHNTGAGKFEDVTAAAGIRSGQWAVAGGWFDFDNDGWLDLFVVNYVRWSLMEDIFCGDPENNIRAYCHPRYFGKLPNTLYRNRGDGTFEDVSEESGIGAHPGRGMAVAFADYDLDGWMDVFVTNDYAANFLFRNRGDGTFEERGTMAGVALRDDGDYISNMGADFRDLDNDGLPDLSVVALASQSFPLFRNLGKGLFRDVTLASQLGGLSLRRSGWSTALADFDNDGWKDMFVSCSHVNDLVEASQYRLVNALFMNQRDGTFIDASAAAGLNRSVPKVHRGAALGDFNSDGRMDVVVSSQNDPAELWENVSPGEANWLMLRLQGVKSNRDGIGARIRVDNQHNQMTTSFGYASSSHQGVHFGLGSKTVAGEVEIRWPSGIAQTLKNVKANQVLDVRESAGR